MTVEGVGVCLEDGGAQRWILRDIGFAAEAGEVVAVCGPSGSGKSTLLNLVGGLRLPEEGSIRLNIGADGKRVSLRVHDLSEAERVRYRRQHVGFIFQFFNLLPTLTVEENVLLPRRLNKLGGGSAQALERLEPSAWAAWVVASRTRFPAANSNGSPSLARSRTRCRWCWRMSPPETSTRPMRIASVECLWEQVRSAGAVLVIATHNERIAEQADRVVALR